MTNQNDVLSLRTNNPYSSGFIFVFPTGDILLERDILIPEKSTGDKYHTIIQNQTLGDIAFKYYGDAKYWWILYDVNNLLDPFNLDEGITLLIPDYYRIKTYS